jgi:pantoate--beta-alanine ligase
MIAARTIAAARAALKVLPRPFGLVPTMGSLHDGHLSLMRRARADCATVVASVFVNPRQFAQGEDFGSYPRDEGRDLRFLANAGVDVAFVPCTAEMYPSDAVTSVHVGGVLTASYEAASRPGHLDGVATVVLKLVQITGCDRLYLGEKDAQQLAVVRRMVADLDVPVDVVGVPTVRATDGLAMSSRNAYLDAVQRSAAPRLHRAMRAGAVVAASGATAERVAGAIADALGDAPDRETPTAPGGGATGHDADAAPPFRLDYVAVVDPNTFEPVAAPRPGHLIVAAARIGGVRLIDNLRLQ